ncbi:hypothetical protein C4D60_Mb01t13150 [Musa balbisiana]|uniref:Uncharacterized protein n=1 Tax=Musa balbisiana TaxID=52838 RepID=A0A4S8JNY1_MUSBA|nr:hypothetical protein C4D60_Mb01t13150 [Musa balbisiana]
MENQSQIYSSTPNYPPEPELELNPTTTKPNLIPLPNPPIPMETLSTPVSSIKALPLFPAATPNHQLRPSTNPSSLPIPAFTNLSARARARAQSHHHQAKSNSTPKSPNSNGDALHSRLLHQSPPFVPRRHPQSPTQALNQPLLPPDPCLHQPIRQSPSSSSIPPPPSQI